MGGPYNDTPFSAVAISGKFADLLDVPPAIMVSGGPFTVATLPNASANQGRYAYVTDLGGGSGMVLSDGFNWKHTSQGTPGYVPATSTIFQTALISPPQVILQGSNIATAVAFKVQPAGLYQGYNIRVAIPSGVFTTLGTFGVGLNSGNITALPVIGGYWYDFAYDGNSIVKLAGGSL